MLIMRFVCCCQAKGPEEISCGHLLGARAFNSPTGLDLDFLIRFTHGEHAWLNYLWPPLLDGEESYEINELFV